MFFFNTLKNFRYTANLTHMNCLLRKFVILDNLDLHFFPPLRVEETSNSARFPIGGEANMSKSRHRQRVMWKHLQSRSLVLLKPENAIEA